MQRSSNFRGPSLVLLAVVHILIFVANLVAVAVLRHGAPYVNPFAHGPVIRSFFADNPRAVEVGSFFLFGSAVPLGIFTATIVSRLRHLGIRAAGTTISLLGGFGAAAFVALSGCVMWAVAQPGATESVAVVQSLYFLSFLFGGMAYAVTFGLLVAGVTITGYFSRLLPKWLAVFGMVIAIAGELSSLSLVIPVANFLIPITRYLGFIWLVIVALQLSQRKTVPQAQAAAS